MELLWHILLFCLASEANGSTRMKRVINGDRVRGRKTGYDAVNYFAAFGTAHGKPWWSLGFWNLLKKHGLYGEISCGGAVLTPTIIETACHCVATFPFGYKDSYVDPALMNHHWEGTMVVYVGVNNRFPTWGHEHEPSMLTIPGIETQKFFVHPKCGKMPETSNVFVSFDVALIRINGNWFTGHNGVPTDTVKLAPLYSREHLNNVFDRYMETQAVCLVIGFGLYGVNYEYPSDVMRLGWQKLTDYKTCIKSTTNDIPDEKNYTEYLSWACARPMDKYNQTLEPGDSGGPIACDNYFIGVASSQFYEGSQLTEVYTANKYIPFVSTFEGRTALQQLVSSLDAYSYPDEVKFFYNITTPKPDLRRKNPHLVIPEKYVVFQELPNTSRSPLFASEVFLLAMILASALLQ